MDGPAHLRQLPLLLRATARRWAWIWTARRTTRACTRCSGRAADVHPQRGRDSVEFVSQDKLTGSVRVGFMSQVSPDGQYVVTTINPASMAAASQERSQQLLRGQFQGLPIPAGVLSDARHSGLVQPRRPDCSRCPAPTTRATCRPTPSGAPTASTWSSPGPRHGPLSAGRAAGRIRQRSQRDADPVRPLPDSLQRRQGRARRSRSPALRATA